MDFHLKTYLSQTSAHGFSHLVKGSSKLPLSRLFWLLAISASFVTSGYMVYSSLQEVDENPISTFVKYVPIEVRVLLKFVMYCTYSMEYVLSFV